MHDLIILGAGPAGLSASIYASRYKINHLVIGKEIGGYLNEIHQIENYPGFQSISGFDLKTKMKEHAEKFGSQIIPETAAAIEKTESGFKITTEKNAYEAANIIFSIGTHFRKLNVPGEEKFLGKGVSYCATCDGPFFKNKNVVVAGGGNSAAVAALMLSEYAQKVSLLYRGESLKCEPVFLDRLAGDEKIEVVCCAIIKEIRGDKKVGSVIVEIQEESGRDKKTKEIATDGVFVEIGSEPSVELLMPLGVLLNDKRFILTNPDQSTNVPGIYAAGDITTNSDGFRQIITAASEGAIAAHSVYGGLKSRT